MTVPVVGLTGGIASGKSTVARRLTERGVPVVDADLLAREVVAPGSEGLRDLVETFGPRVLLPDGTLDRAAVAAVVFADPAQRLKLNAILHPRIALLSAERLAAAQQQPVPYVVYEAPLIVENGLHRNMAALIVVSLDVPLQIQRMKLRDALDEAEAVSRLQAQAPLAAKLAAADYVIENAGSLAALTARVDDVHAQLIARFAGASA